MTVAQNKIDAIIRASRLILRMNRKLPSTRESDKMYYDMLVQYYSRIIDAPKNGGFVAAHTVFFPMEILYALDIIPMHTEVTSWMIAMFLGEYSDLTSAGSEQGLAQEICSPHRGLAGAFALGSIPRPDVMLWSNLVCDNTAKSGELLMEINKCPGYFIDHPFQQTESEMTYLVEELGDMIRFLEYHSGRKMDYKRFSDVVANTDKQIQLYREINELRRAVPSPFNPLGFLQLISVGYLFSGQPEATMYLQTLRDELDADVRAHKGAIAQERFRLMTLFTPPMYLMGFLDKMSQHYGAVSVAEPFFCNWDDGRLDPEKPLESIARKSFMQPVMKMFGPVGDGAIEHVRKSATDYKVDGAIYYADVGCRQSCAMIKTFKDALNEIDIPVLTVDCDVVDPAVTSQDEMSEKLERFFELLEDR